MNRTINDCFRYRTFQIVVNYLLIATLLCAQITSFNAYAASVIPGSGVSILNRSDGPLLPFVKNIIALSTAMRAYPVVASARTPAASDSVSPTEYKRNETPEWATAKNVATSILRERVKRISGAGLEEAGAPSKTGAMHVNRPLAKSLENVLEALADMERELEQSKNTGQTFQRFKTELINAHNARKQTELWLDGISSELISHGFADRVPRVEAFRAQIEGRFNDLDQLQKGLQNELPRSEGAALKRIQDTHDWFGRDPKDAGQSVTSPVTLRQASTQPPVQQSSSTSATISTQSALGNPVAGDLAETVEVRFTPEILQLAASLGNSPSAMYEYVRNRIGFELYFGSRKGAQATLETGAGNDYDQASLLLSLLRSSGIPSRYVRGRADIPVSQILEWLDLTDPAAANSVLNTAGIQATPIVDNTGNITVYRVDRVWVAAYVPYGNYRSAGSDSTGSLWVPLDPALKLSQLQTGVPDNVAFAEDTFLSTIRGQLPADFYRDQVSTYLAGNLPGTSVSDVPVIGPIKAQNLGLLPASLPYTLFSLTTNFTDIPASLRHQSRITLSAGSNLLNSIVDLPAIALNRKTISFVAATAQDQAVIDSFGGLANTPPFTVDVKPQLKLDGTLFLEGNPVSLGSSVNLEIGFIDPEQGETDQVNHPFLHAGDYISINLDAGQVSSDLLTRRTARLIGANATVGTPQEDEDELSGELFNIGGLLYWKRLREADEKTTRLFHYKPVHGVSESLTTSDLDVLLLFDRPYAVTPGSLSLDAARVQLSTFGIDNDNSDSPQLRRLLGFSSSSLEHAMWEELVAVESISTIKALQVASDNGIPLHEFDSASSSQPITCMEGTTNTVLVSMGRCGVSSFAINGISSELAAGKLVKTHECPITLNQWQGLGYITVDPATQVGAYIISGGLNSQQSTGAATTVTEPQQLRRIPEDEGESRRSPIIRAGIGRTPTMERI